MGGSSGSMAGGMAQAGAGVLSIVESGNQAKAIRQQSEFDASQLEFNAELIDLQQADLKQQEEEEILQRQKQVNQMLGSQKVALASQGIEVEGDLGEAFEQEERQIAVEDVQAIKNNRWRESMGLEIQKQDLYTQAQSTRLAGRSKARSTIVSSAIRGGADIIEGAGRAGARPKYGDSDYTHRRPRRMGGSGRAESNYMSRRG